MIVAFMIFAMSATWISYTAYQDRMLCAKQLGIEYSFWSGGEKYFQYKYIDKYHFNCCLEDVHLNTDGYYEKYLCIGFDRGELYERPS